METRTRATDQGPVSFQVSGMSTRRGTPLGAPCSAYDSADHAITCIGRQGHIILEAHSQRPSILCCISHPALKQMGNEFAVYRARCLKLAVPECANLAKSCVVPEIPFWFMY